MQSTKRKNEEEIKDQDKAIGDTGYSKDIMIAFTNMR